MHRKIELGFFLVIAVLALVFTYFIFKPYLTALFLALVIFIVFKPVHKKIVGALGGRPNLSSALTVVVISALILVPFAVFGSILFDEATDLYQRIANNEIRAGLLARASDSVENFIGRFAPRAEIELEDYIGNTLGFVVKNFNQVFSGLFQVAVNLFVMVLGLFFLFRDGDKLKTNLLALSPLPDAYDLDIFDHVERAVNSVVRGYLFIGLIQGLLTGFGFAIFGVPNAALWGAVAAVTSLIPVIGTAAVLIPGIAYLFFGGHLGATAGLLVWGVIAVGLVDNILAPIFIERGIKIHPFLILLSLLGGLSFFGLTGFLAGPVILSIFVTLIHLYPRVVRDAA